MRSMRRSWYFCLAALMAHTMPGPVRAQTGSEPVQHHLDGDSLPVQAGSSQAMSGIVRASDARIAGDERRTRLVVDLSGVVQQNAFLLADPYRVVVDLPEIDF